MNTNTNLRGQAVRIFLGKAGQTMREGTVLVDRGETVLVEYRTGGVDHDLGRDYVTKTVARECVEVLS